MRFNKVYIPREALSRHEDFDVWYEDGTLFFHAESDWKDERSPVSIINMHNAEMARIKPDNKALTYDIRVERYTYQLHTNLIFRHYFLEGMLWQMHGTPSKGHCHFTNEDTDKNDVQVSTVKFREHGECLEVKVRDIAKLRIAAVAVVAILIKEEYKGLSEGERDEDAPWYKKVKQYFLEKGVTYEEVQKGITAPL
jgi:hypothetical protein